MDIQKFPPQLWSFKIIVNTELTLARCVVTISRIGIYLPPET